MVATWKKVFLLQHAEVLCPSSVFKTLADPGEPVCVKLTKTTSTSANTYFIFYTTSRHTIWASHFWPDQARRK